MKKATAEVDQLTPGSRGFWSIETISGSVYLLDLDNRAVQRQASNVNRGGTLRRDGDSVHLLRRYHCQVDGMPLFLNLRIPGIDFLAWISTAVLHISGMRVPLDRAI